MVYHFSGINWRSEDMQNYKLQTPIGVKDYTYDLSKKKEQLTKKLKELFIKNGYHYTETPTFEFLDVFTENHQSLDLYKFTNRYGELVSLRSDMTRSIARLCSSELLDMPFLQKLCYNANIFRMPKEYLGKLHEFTQTGVELIGIDSVYADYEIVSLAIKALQLGLKNDYMLHISSSDFFNNLFSELNIDLDLQNLIFKAIEEKNMVVIKKVLKDAKIDDASLEMIILVIGSVGKLDLIDKIKQNVKTEKTLNSLQRLESLYKLLELSNLDGNVYFDFSLLSYGNYYTGIYFQGYSQNIGNVICEGGRYNNLLKQFNNDRPSVGFAIMINELLDKYEADLKINEVMIYSKNKENVIKYLNNNNGFMSLEESLEDSLKYAKTYKIKNVYDLDNDKLYDCEE